MNKQLSVNAIIGERFGRAAALRELREISSFCTRLLESSIRESESEETHDVWEKSHKAIFSREISQRVDEIVAGLDGFFQPPIFSNSYFDTVNIYTHALAVLLKAYE